MKPTIFRRETGMYIWKKYDDVRNDMQKLTTRSSNTRNPNRKEESMQGGR